MPLFLFFMFMVLQLAELGVALLMTNYAASSVARTAANATSAGGAAVIDLGPYQGKLENLMTAGMTLTDKRACVVRDDPTVPTATLAVAVRAQVQAWPFFSNILSGVWNGQYAPQPLLCPSLVDTQSFGPFNFSAQAPYYFYVTGRAAVRLNYVPAS
jgi:hypothetical protein